MLGVLRAPPNFRVKPRVFSTATQDLDSEATKYLSDSMNGLEKKEPRVLEDKVDERPQDFILNKICRA
jgi:hypothetical protein